MKKKILAALLSAAMVATLLAGCGGGNDAAETTTDAEETTEAEDTTAAEDTADTAEDAGETTADLSGMSFEIVSKGLQHQYWQAVLNGVNSRAEELGVKVNFVGPDNESNIDQQVTQLTNALNSNPTAIGLAALSTESVMKLLQQAKESGIPIIGFDSGVPDAPEGSVLANCSTDNYAAGGIAAENVYAAVADRIAAAEGTVRIGVVAQDNTSESVVNRGLGFIDKFGELAAADGYTVSVTGNDTYINRATCEVSDDAKVIIDVRVPASVTSDLSLADVNALLGEEDILALYGSNEHSANAIISAATNNPIIGTGDDQVIAAGFDSGANQLEAVRNGVLLGSITQAPVAMGETLVDLLVAAAQGETVEDVDTGCQWYTAENMDDPEIAQNLYE